jgi:hypothetical protein
LQVAEPLRLGFCRLYDRFGPLVERAGHPHRLADDLARLAEHFR